MTEGLRDPELPLAIAQNRGGLLLPPTAALGTLPLDPVSLYWNCKMTT
jgi:hypothetical protein